MKVVLASKRCWKPMTSLRRFFFAAVIILLASAADMAMGFSTSTWAPALLAAIEAFA